VFVVLLVAAPACAALDAEQPIALLSDGWTDRQVETLRRAAHCWNLQFGTSLEVAPEVAWPQEVRLRFIDLVCVYAVARTSPSLPVRVDICPMRFFFGESASYRERFLFTTLLHELGHVLNIRSHADDALAIMAGGEQKRPLSQLVPPVFADEDRRLFYDANPNFTTDPPCAKVFVDDSVRPPACGCSN
jgi:hypothetical protein